MTAAELISRALVQERAFVPVEHTELQAGGSIERERYAFVGVRKYWGSVISCGLLVIDREDEQLVAERCAEFYGFSRSLKPYAGRVGLTKLGSFGLLLILLSGPSDEKFRNWVVSQKRGSAWHQDYCLAWLLDVSLREVFPHHGLPLRFFPGADYFRDLLKRWEPDNGWSGRGPLRHHDEIPAELK